MNEFSATKEKLTNELKRDIKTDELNFELKNFTGSVQFYRYSLFNRNNLITEGVNFLCNKLNCYWFLSEIDALQNILKDERFQVWKVKVVGTETIITAEDGNDNVFRKKKIYSTLDISGFTVYAEKNELGGITVLLPGEH